MRPRRFHLIAMGLAYGRWEERPCPKVITEVESPGSTVAGRGSAQSGPGARWTNHLQTPQVKTSIHDLAVSLLRSSCRSARRGEMAAPRRIRGEVSGSGRVHRDFRIAANNVTGSAGAGIQISTDHTTESITGLEVSGNEISAGANPGPGPLSDIRLVPRNGTGRWLDRVLVTGNNIATDVKIERDAQTVPYVAISGNPGAVAIFAGDGTLTKRCPPLQAASSSAPTAQPGPPPTSRHRRPAPGFSWRPWRRSHQTPSAKACPGCRRMKRKATWRPPSLQRRGGAPLQPRSTPPSLPNLRFQNSATLFDLGVYAARSYSLMMPSRIGLRLVRSWEGRRPGAPDTRLIDRSSAQD